MIDGNFVCNKRRTSFVGESCPAETEPADMRICEKDGSVRLESFEVDFLVNGNSIRQKCCAAFADEGRLAEGEFAADARTV